MEVQQVYVALVSFTLFESPVERSLQGDWTSYPLVGKRQGSGGIHVYTSCMMSALTSPSYNVQHDAALSGHLTLHKTAPRGR